MNSTEGSPEELFKTKQIYALLENYLEVCVGSLDEERTVSENICADGNKKLKAKARSGKKSPECSFPNVAGFCRFLGVSTGELERLGSEYPEEHGRILAVLEDEALNSDLSPTLITAYLKRRLGYDAPARAVAQKDQICISFEHDIIEDGE